MNPVSTLQLMAYVATTAMAVASIIAVLVINRGSIKRSEVESWRKESESDKYQIETLQKLLEQTKAELTACINEKVAIMTTLTNRILDKRKDE